MKKMLTAAFVLVTVFFTENSQAQVRPPRYTCTAISHGESFGGKEFINQTSAEDNACKPCKAKYSANTCYKGCQTFDYRTNRWKPILGNVTCK